MNSVVVSSSARTAIGSFGRSLVGVPPSELGATAARAAIARAGLEPESVEQVVFGHVIHTAPEDMYLGRVVGMKAGVPKETPALTLNRLCGSGLQAILTAAQVIQTGDADVAVAGGAESMSRGAYWMQNARWGARMGDASMVDAVVGCLTDPFNDIHMGVTAENLAESHGISREVQDKFALESHRRAVAARDAGKFIDEIVPVEIKSRNQTIAFAVDEHPRSEVSMEGLAKLRPAFSTEGTVTAGNASGINDAAAAVVLADAEFAERHGHSPLGRLVAYAHAGVEPRIMGIGPVPAVRQVLDRAGMKVDDIDLFEVNEAFAAQALAVVRELGLPPDRTNPNGSGISLGHPIGATGSILAVKALYELRRAGGRYPLVTMCIGGGQGIAAIFERA